MGGTGQKYQVNMFQRVPRPASSDEAGHYCAQPEGIRREIQEKEVIKA